MAFNATLLTSTTAKVDPNLSTNVGYKEILLRKLSCAVISSVLSQITILSLYLFVINLNIFNPREWLTLTVSTLTSLNTWLFLIPFSSIIFAQSVICAKDYVLQPKYPTTRFQKMFNVLSLRNFILLVLHTAVGGLLVWLYVTVTNMYSEEAVCTKEDYCYDPRLLFLILSGLFTGLYFFVCVYIKDKKLEFPVIQQRKLLQLKTSIVPLIKESRMAAFWPVLYFSIGYNLGRIYLQTFFTSDVPVSTINFWVYLYAWLLSALYFFNMNLMRFLFNLYLAEPIEFTLDHTKNTFNLQHALTMNNLPIVQNLACLDLFILSFWSPQRRQQLFSLSQPGGHPYTWNMLIENALKLITKYIEVLNKSVDQIITPEKLRKDIGFTKQNPVTLQSPTSPYQYTNMRNMSLRLQEPSDIITVQHMHVATPTLLTKDFLKSIGEKFQKVATTIKLKVGYNYLFDELPEMNIQKCFGNGRIIIWTTQSIASIAAASVEEDRYGVVQKDLPAILTTLVQLKQALDKLNKVPAFNRRFASYDSFNYKMRLALGAAVKRSLVNICKTFGEYLDELNLKQEVRKQLDWFVPKDS